MKHLIARTLTSLTIAIVGLAMLSHAESSEVIKVNIPFEFTFAGQTFPAGDYSLTKPLQNYLMLRDSRGHAIAQTFTAGVVSLKPVTAPKLVFDSAEGQHVLTEVWQQEDVGQRLYPATRRTTFAKHHSSEAREASEGSQP